MNRTITQLVTLLRTFADELEAVTPLPDLSDAPAPAKKRGRPAATPPADPPADIPAEEPKGMTLDALKALIEPAVKAGAGAQVKGIITKHGGTQLSSIPAANHAAFAADVEALVY